MQGNSCWHILMSLGVTLSAWVVHVHMARYTYELVHVGILDAVVHLLHVFDNYRMNSSN